MKMKFTTLTALTAVGLFAGTANADLLVGWHDFGTGNNNFEVGAGKAPDAGAVTGTVVGGDGNRGAFSSTDGTYGPTEATGNTATNGGMALRTETSDEATLDIVIANNLADDIVLGVFLFDFAAIALDGPDKISLAYASGDLAIPDGTLIGGFDNINALGTPGVASDWFDASFSLAGLTDQTLATGELATFRLTVSNADNLGQALGVDNIAITGSIVPVPEPTSLALLGLGGLCMVKRRRR